MSKWLSSQTHRLSTLLDSVDSIAKESLVDPASQETAAERRRQRVREEGRLVGDQSDSYASPLPRSERSQATPLWGQENSQTVSNQQSPVEVIWSSTQDGDLSPTPNDISDVSIRLTPIPPDVSSPASDNATTIILGADVTTTSVYTSTPAGAVQQKPLLSPKYVDNQQSSSQGLASSTKAPVSQDGSSTPIAAPMSNSGQNAGASAIKALGLLGRVAGTRRSQDGTAPSLDQDREIKQLKHEVEELSLELEGMEDKLKGREAELRDAVERLSRERERSAGTIFDLQESMSRLLAEQTRQEEDFSTAMEAKDAALSSAASDLKAARAEQQLLSAALQHERERVAAAEGEGGDFAAVAVAARQAAESAAQAAEIQVQVLRESATRAAEQARYRQEQLEAANSELGHKLAELRRELDGYRNSLLRNGSGRSGADREEVEALRRDLGEVQLEVETGRGALHAAQQEILLLRHEVTATRTAAAEDRSVLEHRAVEAQNRVGALQQELAQARAAAQPAKGDSDAEARLKATTDRLLKKQQLAEQLACERSMLQSKLKAAERRGFQLEAALQQNGGVLSDTECGNSSLRSPPPSSGGLRQLTGRKQGGSGTISALAPGLAKHKRVAKAMDSMDRLCLTAGTFLRKTPSARLLFLLYLIVLHLWVCAIIGLHSQSIEEMHPDTGTPDMVLPTADTVIKMPTHEELVAGLKG